MFKPCSFEVKKCKITIGQGSQLGVVTMCNTQSTKHDRSVILGDRGHPFLEVTLLARLKVVYIMCGFNIIRFVALQNFNRGNVCQSLVRV